MPKRRAEPPPSMELLLQRFEYRPETKELLFWKERSVDSFRSLRAAAIWNKRWAGQPAFTCVMKNGYRMGRIDWAAYYLHQVIWALATGAWPTDEIDHINGDTRDNRIENLRQANRSQQLRNRIRGRGGRLPRGVQRNNQIGGLAFIARIQVNGKGHYLGSFETPEEAYAAYLKAATELHGEHAFHRSRSKVD